MTYSRLIEKISERMSSAGYYKVISERSVLTEYSLPTETLALKCIVKEIEIYLQELMGEHFVGGLFLLHFNKDKII